MIKTIITNIGLIAVAAAIFWAGGQVTMSVNDFAQGFERLDRQVAAFNACGDKLANAIGFSVKK